MLVPERTVDSLLAYELLRAFPSAILWSPTNTAGSLDHKLFAGGTRAILFECKGLRKGWRIPIRIPQLDEYVSRGLGRLLYLLPSKPVIPNAPWEVVCGSDPDAKGRCKACATSFAQDHRRLAGSSPHVATSSPERRLQPWFNHWAWCIPATQLQAHLRSRRGEVGMEGSDGALAKIAGARRLCHLLPQTSSSQPPEGISGRGKSERPPSSGGTVGTGPTGPGPDMGNIDGARSPTKDSPGPLEPFAFALDEVESFWANVNREESRSMRPGSVGILL